MKMRHWIPLAALTIGLTACGGKKEGKADDPLSDTGRTVRTETLLANLKTLPEQGYMFGHHDDPVYGIGWVGDSCRSDVKSVCGDFPAVMSFDLGHLELGDSVNLDKVPFSRIREEVIRQFDRGGMVTFSWHLDNPLTGGDSWDVTSAEVVASVLEGGAQHDKFLTWLDRVAEFLNSLETPYGVKVPVLFRPWHEHTGSWFWWGEKLCSAEQYKALWKLTQDRLKEQGVTNALYAYSPGTEADGQSEKYLERYPGDEAIDLLGLDAYCFSPDADSTAIAAYAGTLEKNLKMICDLARERDKAVALTETGYESIPAENWWTETLMPVVNRFPLCYVLVWRNAHDKAGHFYAPYPGQKSAADFVKFYNDRKTLFLKDVNGLYVKKNM